MSNNTLSWQEVDFLIEVEGRKSVVGLIGKREAPSRYDQNIEVVLFRFMADEADEPWRAMRWKLGVVINLQTDDLNHARATIDAMYQLEGA